MKKEKLSSILEEFQYNKINKQNAYKKINDLMYKSIENLNFDTYREERTKVPEVVFCKHKTLEQVKSIFENSYKINQHLLGTWVSEEMGEKISQEIPQIIFNKTARTLQYGFGTQINKDSTVAIISGGTSDLPIVEEAAVTARFLGNEVLQFSDIGVAGIHRLFDHIDDINSCNVIIAVAGMEGALASVIAGLSDKPVIAVPTSVGYGVSLNGITALLAMLNSCAPGVSVVNIDNGFGAACQASKINNLLSK